MQEGIGRGGYRALALVFCAVGLVGLLVAALADRPSGFGWVGLLLAAAGLVALPFLVRAVLGLDGTLRARVRAEPRGAPDEAAPVPLPTPEPPLEADPDADIGFEYSDPTPTPVARAPAPVALSAAPASTVSLSSPWEMDEPGPEFEAPMAAATRPRTMSLPPPAPKPAARAPPPPMARPRAHSAPPSGKSAADSGWPERRGKAGVTRRQVAESSGAAPPPSRRDLPRDPGPAVEVEGPGPARRDPPIVMAKTVASAEATGIPEGVGVGKCGNCGVLLLAPKKRPIRLQCPRCERVHLLA